MVKAVVSSFYNSLINSEEAIPLSTMLEIERIRKKGIVFSVCTNGTYEDVLYYNRDFPFLDYIIALNGSYLYDVSKNKCLYQKKLPISTIKKLIKIFPDFEMSFLTATKKLTDISTTEENIYKIEIEITNKKIDLSSLSNLNIATSLLKRNNKKYLEITSNLTSNYLALEKILTKKKITEEEVIVICANESDLSLIKNIPNNYLVSNASKDLKKYASGKTKSNDLKGVENILKKV